MSPFQILKEALIGRKIYVHKQNGKYFHLFDKSFGSEKTEVEILDFESDSDFNSDFQILIKGSENSFIFEWIEVNKYENISFVEDVNSDIDNNQEK